MKSRFAILSVLAFALAGSGCATYQPGYADGSYTGAYNDGYYASAQNGYGDYYYDRPQVVYDDYGFYSGFGFGYGYGPWGFGYNPWFYRPWWGYNPWCGWGGWHHHHHWQTGHETWPHIARASQAPMPVMARGTDPRGEGRGATRGNPRSAPSRGWQRNPVR
jgi:hypothetical protein